MKPGAPYQLADGAVQLSLFGETLPFSDYADGIQMSDDDGDDNQSPTTGQGKERN